MTVVDKSGRTDVDGNGVTTTFAVGFKFTDDDSLLVYKTDTLTDTYTVQVINTDYTITGAGTDSAQVVFVTAPLFTDRLSFVINEPFTQATVYTPADKFPASSHEAALDKLTLIAQQLRESSNRAVTLSPNMDPAVVSPSLPQPEAGLLLSWNSTATGFTNSGAAGTVLYPLAVSLGGTEATDAAGARTNLGLGSAATKNASVTPTAGDVILWDTGNKYPQGDASQVYNLPAIPVRQTVGYGAVDSSGRANMLSAGTGLALNLSATATPMRVFFANGLYDNMSTLSADVSSVVSGLAANARSYVYCDYTNLTSVSWGKTKASPQYGYSYDKAAQSCLSLNNTILDDFGNTWTNTGVTFTNTSPMISGTYMGVFNGSSYITGSSFLSLGSRSWTVRMKVKLTSLAAAQFIFKAYNGAGYGLQLQCTAAGKLSLHISSDGNSWNVASALLGSSTLAINTAYDIELTYDSVAGKYFVYLDGVSEGGSFPITSANKLCSVTSLRLGANSDGTSPILTGYMQGFEFLPYCLHPNGTTFTPPTTLADITTAGYASDFFQIPTMKMYKVMGVSTVAGSNPTFTQVVRCYVGECVTGASSVSSVSNYALNATYDSGPVADIPGTSSSASVNHNIGTKAGIHVIPYLVCVSGDNSYSVGDIVIGQYSANGSYDDGQPYWYDSLSVGFGTNSSVSARAIPKTGGGGNDNLDNTAWKYGFIVKRVGW